MQFWFARGSEVSIREQLVTQVVLGILSDDLAPGQRLPSTRDLARRFRLHANTVSAGYRQLERDKWVEFRRGSGVYVRAYKPHRPQTSAVALDQMIAQLFRSARELGLLLPELRGRLRRWLELQPPDYFLLIEPDEELRRILTAEIAHSVIFPVRSSGIEECAKLIAGSIPVLLPNRATRVRQLVPAETELLTLQLRSVPASLAGYLPAPTGKLVGVASRWREFLKVARAVLTAVGFHPDCLVLRDASESDWQRGLKETAAVVCDMLTAAELPAGCRAIPFSLLLNWRSAEGECRCPRGADTMAAAQQHHGWLIATQVMCLSELGSALRLGQQSARPGLSTTERRLGVGFSSEVRCSVSWAQPSARVTPSTIHSCAEEELIRYGLRITRRVTSGRPQLRGTRKRHYPLQSNQPCRASQTTLKRVLQRHQKHRLAQRSRL